MTQSPVASSYKLCYSSNIQTLFKLLRSKQPGGANGANAECDVVVGAEVAESLAALEMTLKRWKTPTGMYTVLKYVKSPLQTMYSAQNVTQQLGQDLVCANDLEAATATATATANATIQGRGLFRSVVINDAGNVVAFSPPKTVAFNELVDTPTLDQSLSLTPVFEVEEFVEGTMINLFYNPNVTVNDSSSSSSSSADHIISGWEMATKGAVGGSVFVPAPNANATKSAVAAAVAAAVDAATSEPERAENTEKETYKGNDKGNDKASKVTFRALFLDACIENGIEFDKLDTRYCYSLVLQHPKNPLICHIGKPRVYLVAVYSIDNDTLTVTRHPRSIIDWKPLGFHVPRAYNGPILASTSSSSSRERGRAPTAVAEAMPEITFQHIRTLCADPGGSTPYRIMGAVFNARNGAGWSFKLRNPAYETAKRTPSDAGKRQLFEYCSLRRTHGISTHLKLFPDDGATFTEFQSRIVAYTRLLYSSYIECFITKKQPLLDYAAHLRTHMYRIHNEIYKPRRAAIADDAPTKVGLKFQDAVQYVNLIMTPTELFHALAYKTHAI